MALGKFNNLLQLLLPRSSTRASSRGRSSSKWRRAGRAAGGVEGRVRAAHEDREGRRAARWPEERREGAPAASAGGGGQVPQGGRRPRSDLFEGSSSRQRFSPFPFTSTRRGAIAFSTLLTWERAAGKRWRTRLAASAALLASSRVPTTAKLVAAQPPPRGDAFCIFKETFEEFIRLQGLRRHYPRDSEGSSRLRRQRGAR